MTPALCLTLALLAGSERVIDAAFDAAAGRFRSCFEMRGIPDGEAVLRFRVSRDGHPERIEVTRATFDDGGLTRCLLATVASIALPKSAAGADVEYPLRFRSEPGEAFTAAPARAPDLRIVDRGADWAVVDTAGRPLSDLDFAARLEDTALAERLADRRGDLILLLVGEGLLSAAGLGLGAYGAYRAFGPDGSVGGAEVALMGAGGGVWGVAGILFLYHLVRLTDLYSEDPVWHHLERAEAAERIAE